MLCHKHVANGLHTSSFGLTSHLHLGLSRKSVRSLTLCTQLPRTGFFHQTSWPDLDVIKAGVRSFYTKSHSEAIMG